MKRLTGFTAFVLLVVFSFLSTDLRSTCITKEPYVGTCNLQDNCENLPQTKDCGGSTNIAFED